MTKKEKKKNKEKKFGALLLLLFLSVVLLATSTYAWFTANETVTISSLDIYVEASSGIQISTDAVNWKTFIQNTDITAGYTAGSVTDTNQVPGVLSAVSTVGDVDETTGFMNMYYGTVAADKEGADVGVFKLTATKDTETKGTSGHFIAFDIFLKLDEAKPIYLAKGSGVKVKTGENDKGLQYASRIGIINHGTASGTPTQATAVALKAAESVEIIEPNFDGHTAHGVQQATDYYPEYTYPENFAAASSGIGAVSYDGVKAVIGTGIPLVNTNATDNSTYFDTVSPMTLSGAFCNADTSVTSNQSLYSSLPAGVTKLRIYMWIEGQDVDCENNASGSYLTYNLSFTINAN